MTCHGPSTVPLNVDSSVGQVSVAMVLIVVVLTNESMVPNVVVTTTLLPLHVHILFLGTLHTGLANLFDLIIVVVVFVIGLLLIMLLLLLIGG